MEPSRPALRWFGAKWQLAPWVIQHFPPHDGYVEPYGGAASVLLRKRPAKLETWNDLHGRLVNFFRVLREHPSKLVETLESTPYARAEYDLAHHQHPDPLEDARRFYVLSWQGRVGAASDPNGSRSPGWRYGVDEAKRRVSPATEFTELSHLRTVAARLKHVQIEHDQATAVINRFDGLRVLHYVDPPYWDPTADLRSRYAFTMTEVDHATLAAALHACTGMVVLSGRPSDLYNGLYADWQRVDRQARISSGQLGTESLWLSPAATAGQQQRNLWDAS